VSDSSFFSGLLRVAVASQSGRSSGTNGEVSGLSGALSSAGFPFIDLSLSFVGGSGVPLAGAGDSFLSVASPRNASKSKADSEWSGVMAGVFLISCSAPVSS